MAVGIDEGLLDDVGAASIGRAPRARYFFCVGPPGLMLPERSCRAAEALARLALMLAPSVSHFAIRSDAAATVDGLSELLRKMVRSLRACWNGEKVAAPSA